MKNLKIVVGFLEKKGSIMLQVLSKMSGGEEYFIGKKKKLWIG